MHARIAQQVEFGLWDYIESEFMIEFIEWDIAETVCHQLNIHLFPEFYTDEIIDS